MVAADKLVLGTIAPIRRYFVQRFFLIFCIFATVFVLPSALYDCSMSVHTSVDLQLYGESVSKRTRVLDGAE